MRYPVTALATLMLMGVSAPALAAPAKWVDKEFRQEGTPPLGEVERYLNEECRPSGLDGIHTYGIQNGHAQPQNLHIICRMDGARRVHYTATMLTAPKGGIGKVIAARHQSYTPFILGPFHFGENGGDDGILVITKDGR